MQIEPSPKPLRAARRHPLILLACLSACQAAPLPQPSPTPLPSPSASLTVLPAPSASTSPQAAPSATATPLPIPSGSPCPAENASLHSAAAPSWSPDRRWLLYLRSRQSVTRHGGALCGDASVLHEEAWHLLDLDSGYSHALWPDASYTEPGKARPAWSPDGSQAALLARAGQDRWRVFLLTGASRQLQALDASPPEAQAPSWSPDGQNLYLAGFESDTRLNLTRLHLASNQLLPLGSFALDRSQELWQHWLPRRGRLLVLQDGDGVVSLRLHASGQTPATLWQQRGDGPLRSEGLSVSPDEAYAAFWLRSADRVSLYLTDLDKNETQEIHRAANTLPQLDWRRDSSELAFTAQAEGTGPFELWSYSPAGARLRQLTRSPAVAGGAAIRNHAPAWSPDGQSLIFVSSRPASGAESFPREELFSAVRPEALWRLELASGALTRLTCAGRGDSPSHAADDSDPWLSESGPAISCPNTGS